jgi:hypothetical protein
VIKSVSTITAFHLGDNVLTSSLWYGMGKYMLVAQMKLIFVVQFKISLDSVLEKKKTKT